MKDNTNQTIAEWLGFRVFIPSEVKFRSEYDRECYGHINQPYIVLKSKRPATHMIDACPLPRFDFEANDCFGLIDILRKKGYGLSILSFVDTWIVRITLDSEARLASGRKHWQAEASSLAAAIAKATVKVIKAEVNA